MTKLAVPITVHSLDQALLEAVQAAERGADLVEFRIDEFTAKAQLAELTQLVERSPLPSIITCRSAREGGQYDGDEQTRISLLQHACLGSRQPIYIDVELATYQQSANLRQKVGLVVDHPGQLKPVTTGLILSSHDFTSHPADLYQRLEAMTASPACRVVKVAWKARSLRDNLEAFEILLARHKPTIALCMGETGLPSRVLAKKFGALLTFAALDHSSATAPGQPTLQQIKSLYRWDHIAAQTRVYGVIGYPVAHSKSPAIHNAGFDAISFDGVYLPMPIPPEYEHFKATVGAWLDFAPLHFRGASVTIPHKENLLRFVAERNGVIEPLARRIGAANTLTVRDDGLLYASNTDYAAALDAVCAGMGITRKQLRGVKVAVLGAGGAARAIVAGFAQHGAEVVIYNRTHDRAEQLAREFNRLPEDGGPVAAARLEEIADSRCQVYINCTPLGMHPKVDDTPMPADQYSPALGPGAVVFDTIYNPAQTRLLQEARQAGCLTIPGIEMFVRQAVGQFELWTGSPAPIDLFRKVVQPAAGH